MMKNFKVNILGVIYNVIFKEEDDDPILEKHDGYIDYSIQSIFIAKLKSREDSMKDLAYITKSVIRHEIIHAFLYESGLYANAQNNNQAWSQNEEMVDWFAIQSPKIFEIFKKHNLMGGKI